MYAPSTTDNKTGLSRGGEKGKACERNWSFVWTTVTEGPSVIGGRGGDGGND